jgi:hypothetical protein
MVYFVVRYFRAPPYEEFQVSLKENLISNTSTISNAWKFKTAKPLGESLRTLDGFSQEKEQGSWHPAASSPAWRSSNSFG